MWRWRTVSALHGGLRSTTSPRMEDIAPWQLTDHYVRVARSSAVPLCTGEDIFLHRNFELPGQAGGVSVIHPDVLTVGGAWR